MSSQQTEPPTSITPHAPSSCPTATPRDSPSQTLATGLLQNCTSLVSELTAFQSHLSAAGRPNVVEFRQFKSVIQSELRSLQRLYEKAVLAAEESEKQRREQERSNGHGEVEYEDEDSYEEDPISDAEARLLHSLRSSNLPFYATVWNVAKTKCRNLVAFSKRFYWHEIKGRGSATFGLEDMAALESHFKSLDVSGDRESKKKGSGRENAAAGAVVKKSVLVDIVADNGEEWVKVSTVTPNRLLFELAKLGWEAGDSESESDEDIVRLQHDDDEDDEDMVELVKLAADMKKAAAVIRVRYKHPRIRFVLPKIVEGQLPEVDRVIRDIRKTGVTVECGTRFEDWFDLATSKQISRPTTPVSLENVLPSILPNQYAHRTDTLNVDCTLLLALVSDVSHVRDIAPSPSLHPAIARQIELETKQPLVPSELWPVMGNKELVCTKEARDRMEDIVDTIGTVTERARTKLLMGKTDGLVDREALISKFQQLSDHRVPEDWKIPIRVVDAHAEIQKGWGSGSLPKLARKVEAKLSDINTSVFLYGWASDLMTVSSNRTVVKQIEILVEENRNGDDDVAGPNVWVCDTARSLVGKEHNKKYQAARE